MNSTDKRRILEAIVEQIDAEIATMTRIAREAAEAVSHEDNRAEGSKDMRSTEASYIARGQAERAMELERSRARLGSLDLKEFNANSSIEATALVELQHQRQRSYYFLLPVGGGRRVDYAGTTIHTITPTSPLGSALLGLSVSDEVEVPTPSTPKLYEVMTLV
ncbi:MAG TPA: GreA/GreB family elongation factor [Polyangiaceae bacterium]|nr:GreA/GreB family elongation factor [Polyangiaceae bacterium]